MALLTMCLLISFSSTFRSCYKVVWRKATSVMISYVFAPLRLSDFALCLFAPFPLRKVRLAERAPLRRQRHDAQLAHDLPGG